MSTDAAPLEGRALFLYCACCPTPCRRAMPMDDAAQHEACTPSSLSMIALAVIDGQLAPDAATRAALARTAAARACRAACPYGFDVAGAVEAFAAGLGPAPAAADAAAAGAGAGAGAAAGGPSTGGAR
ncbi:MAG TPA: hypothetical protein PLP74_06430 [Quisquiliibacterium sp.]|nr:hypothetical protein [Quisquiliibacterium sp.]HQD85265.1 hypothetical protein [Quisquiliibacterium sp.]HQN11741.1 hypothetical protein [Quisquiliibacterium sp.]